MRDKDRFPLTDLVKVLLIPRSDPGWPRKSIQLVHKAQLPQTQSVA
jgi:hypothetical protein